MSTERNTDRRRFLATSAMAGVAITSARTMVACGAPCTPGFVDSGLTAGDLAVGDVRCPSSANYFVARDAQGYFAYSNICTHEQCAVSCPGSTSPSATQGRISGISTCPCHSSQYDGEGNRLSGPAPSDLPHVALSFSGTGPTARILVDPCTTVADRTSRATAP